MCHHGQCGSDDNDTVHNLEGDNVGAGRSCGSGACPSGGAHGPWSVCQGEFFVPVKHIDELAAWVADNALSLDIMRHPNTGCQWGDHSVRAEWLSGKWGLGPGSLPGEPSLAGPEMCLWGLPCNNVGYGCVQGMCGSGNGKREKQHCSGCTMLAH